MVGVERPSADVRVVHNDAGLNPISAHLSARQSSELASSPFCDRLSNTATLYAFVTNHRVDLAASVANGRDYSSAERASVDELHTFRGWYRGCSVRIVHDNTPVGRLNEYRDSDPLPKCFDARSNQRRGPSGRANARVRNMDINTMGCATDVLHPRNSTD
jgi:hypothetical protein